MPDTILGQSASAPAAALPCAPTVPLKDVSLDDKYTATSGKIFLSGIQALVRLPMIQKLRDQAAGLNTAGSAAWTRTCGRPRATSKRTRCSSCRA
jgi:indolepyruvate ferredoxin oxidoreductase